MAKSAFTIEMNFNKAIEQAKKLEEAARKITKQESLMTDYERNLKSNWTGDNATAYLKKMNNVNVELKKIAKNLNETATAIRKIAKKTYDAEMKALELAKVRTYGGQ